MKRKAVFKRSIVLMLMFCIIISSQLIVSAYSHSYDSMYQAIIDKGNANSWVGQPISYYSLVKGGMYIQYQNAYIYYNDSTGAAYLLYGAIYERWKWLGGENFLGMPTTDETSTPDGTGRYNHFDGGSIYWTPLTGAYEVYGCIRNKWIEMGWEQSYLGYPISGELPCADGVGRYSKFQGGAIYYHPTYGTHPISGALYRKFCDNGYENGYLGYPKGDPVKYAQPVAVSVKESASTTKPYFLSYTAIRQSFSKGYTIYDNTANARNVDLRGEIGRRNIAIDDQGNRGTCAVFAMTFLLEYQYTGLTPNTDFNDLSQEFLDHYSIDRGVCPFDGAKNAYDQFGIIPNGYLPYDGSQSPNYDTISSRITQDMLNYGSYTIQRGNKLNGRFIKTPESPEGFTDSEFKDVLSCLFRGVPVAIGRGHCMAAVGYRINPNIAGGGEFIFRNSWGTGSGDNGYVTESFASVRSTARDTFVYEGLVDLPHIGRR